jgi:hypothetical protein
MDNGISEIVGRACLQDGKSTRIYRALRSLVCSTCGAEIATGSHFTRRRVKGIGISIMPQCSKCEPFTLQPGKAQKSALLRSLLAEPQEDTQSRTDLAPITDSEAQVKEKSIAEEVRKRLGPALKRGRRGDKMG